MAAAACRQLTLRFPNDERFGLTVQLNRAAASVALNIAEGNGRFTTKEYIHFLGIAHGSASEVITCIYIALELGYIDEADYLLTEYDQISRIITAIANKLRHNLQPSNPQNPKP